MQTALGTPQTARSEEVNAMAQVNYQTSGGNRLQRLPSAPVYLPAFILRQTMKISQVAAWSQGSTNGRLEPMVTIASQQLPVKRGQLIHTACVSRRF